MYITQKYFTMDDREYIIRIYHCLFISSFSIIFGITGSKWLGFCASSFIQGTL